MPFLEWYADKDSRDERREIRQCLRCTETEAVMIQQLADLAGGFHELANEVYAMSLKGTENDDE